MDRTAPDDGSYGDANQYLHSRACPRPAARRDLPADTVRSLVRSCGGWLRGRLPPRTRPVSPGSVVPTGRPESPVQPVVARERPRPRKAAQTHWSEDMKMASEGASRVIHPRGPLRGLRSGTSCLRGGSGRGSPSSALATTPTPSASACFAWSSRSGLEAPDAGDSIDPAIEGGDHADPRNLGGRAKVRIGKIEPFGLVELDGPQQQLVVGRHGRESQQSPGGVGHLIARTLVVGLQDVDQLS